MTIEEILDDDEAITKFEYRTYGPLALSSRDDLSSSLVADEYWDELDDKHPGLRSAIGVYIFAIKPTKRSRFIPWYVGLTDRGFERRFHDHKKLFPKLLSKNGQAVVFLIARLKRDSDEFMGQRKRVASNHVLETLLIERCLEQNHLLFNDSKVKYVKGFVVPGFKGKTLGAPSKSSRQLNKLLSGKVSEEL